MNFSLPTFLKLCMLDTGAAISELQKRVNGPSGYDFYHTLYGAIRHYALTKDSDESRDEILQVTNDSERSNNLQAFENFLGHVDKWRSQMRIEVMSMKPRKLSAVLS